MPHETLENTLIHLADMPGAAFSDRAQSLACISLLDWLTCGVAGSGEPVAHAIRAWAKAEGSTPAATFFGDGKGSARMAALVNGTISHAIDYDDTHFAHIGHLSVGLFPAALAVAQARDLALSDVIDAFLAGAEGAIRVGLALGAGHYNLGFHQTATAGAFGATLAAARLLRLTQEQTQHALGLCATRASGLKSQFGTMGKPYNAGLAASNGVECASLAAAGLTSAERGISGPQGFLATHAADGAAIPAADQSLFEGNLYKLHACCHGLHAMIEALEPLRGTDLRGVPALEVRTNPRWLRVCDIKAPRTGLEVKFSYAWLAGMTLRGNPTGDPTLYTDAVAGDPALAAFAQNVTVVGDPALTDLETRVRVTISDPRDFAHDLAAPVSLPVLQGKLRRKAVQAIGEGRAAAIWDSLDTLGAQSAQQIAPLMACAAPAEPD